MNTALIINKTIDILVWPLLAIVRLKRKLTRTKKNNDGTDAKEE